MAQTGRTTRVGQAYAGLKEEIRSNRMPAGFQATEPEVAQLLGMSRTPVREALIRLQSEGLVELIPRRGVRVLPLRIDDLREIYQILNTIEPEAAGVLASRRPCATTLKPLQNAMNRMEETIGQDMNDWAMANDDFHMGILTLHGNRRMLRIASSLLDQAHRAQITILPMREVLHRSIEEHREVLANIAAGDAEGARRSLRAHRDRTTAEMIALLEKFQLGQI